MGHDGQKSIFEVVDGAQLKSEQWNQTCATQLCNFQTLRNQLSWVRSLDSYVLI